MDLHDGSSNTARPLGSPHRQQYDVNAMTTKAVGSFQFAGVNRMWYGGQRHTIVGFACRADRVSIVREGRKQWRDLYRHRYTYVSARTTDTAMYAVPLQSINPTVKLFGMPLNHPLLTGRLPLTNIDDGDSGSVGTAFVRAHPVSTFNPMLLTFKSTGQPAFVMRYVDYTIFYPCSPVPGSKGTTKWFPPHQNAVVNGFKKYLKLGCLSWSGKCSLLYILSDCL